MSEETHAAGNKWKTFVRVRLTEKLWCSAVCMSIQAWAAVLMIHLWRLQPFIHETLTMFGKGKKKINNYTGLDIHLVITCLCQKTAKLAQSMYFLVRLPACAFYHPCERRPSADLPALNNTRDRNSRKQLDFKINLQNLTRFPWFAHYFSSCLDKDSRSFYIDCTLRKNERY